MGFKCAVGEPCCEFACDCDCDCDCDREGLEAADADADADAVATPATIGERGAMIEKRPYFGRRLTYRPGLDSRRLPLTLSSPPATLDATLPAVLVPGPVFLP